LKSVWKKYPFDDKVTNIEDRLWASQVLEQGYQILYEPESEVYHHHGIHHSGDTNRLIKTVNVMEESVKLNYKKDLGKLKPENLNILALIPHKGKIEFIDDLPIIDYTIKDSFYSKYIKETIVLTDNPDIGDYAENLGASVPILRTKEFSKDYVDLSMVYSHYLNILEENGFHSDVIISLEPSYIFRSMNLIDNLISLMLNGGYDTVLPVTKDYKLAWLEKENKTVRIDKGDMPKELKKPLLIGMKGLGCVTFTEFIREGRMTGDNIGLYEIEDGLQTLEFQHTNKIDSLSELILSVKGKLKPTP